jgi:hypothetical protein
VPFTLLKVTFASPVGSNRPHYFFLFEYNVLPFSFKGLSKFKITRGRANISKPLNSEGLFLVVQFTLGIHKSDPGLTHNGALALSRKPGIQIL